MWGLGGNWRWRAGKVGGTWTLLIDSIAGSVFITIMQGLCFLTGELSEMESTPHVVGELVFILITRATIIKFLSPLFAQRSVPRDL